MSEIIERVAQAISGSNDSANILSIHRSRARLAIEAMREPTEGMILAGERAEIPEGDSPAYVNWRAMIDAALK